MTPEEEIVLLRVVAEAAKPFMSGGDWGKWKAWMVEGGPLRAPGIEAARRLTGWQADLDDALSALERAGGPPSS